MIRTGGEFRISNFSALADRLRRVMGGRRFCGRILTRTNYIARLSIFKKRERRFGGAQNVKRALQVLAACKAKKLRAFQIITHLQVLAGRFVALLCWFPIGWWIFCLFGALLLGVIVDGMVPSAHGAVSLFAVGIVLYLAAQEAAHALEKRGQWDAGIAVDFDFAVRGGPGLLLVAQTNPT